MKRSHIVAIVVAAIVGFCFIVTASRSQSRLTILINGSPAAYLTVTDFQTMLPRKLDATGSVAYNVDSSIQNAILVPMKNEIQRIVSLPEQGHKTVDLQDRLVLAKTVVYKFGFIRSEKTSVQHDLTDAEIAAIEVSDITTSEAHESIKDEAEP